MLLGVKPSRFFNVAYSLGNLASKPEYPLTAGSTYCLLCAETYGLPREDTVQSEVEFEIAPDEILQTVCGRCFAGFLAESATA